MDVKTAPAVQPRFIILCPLRQELSLLIAALEQRQPYKQLLSLKIDNAYFHSWRTLVALGGHGKTQLAVHAQYLLTEFPNAECIICAGSAGTLTPELSVGDVVVGTETVEHDYRLLFETRPLPRFAGDEQTIAALRRIADEDKSFQMVFDIIASGDEDVVSTERACAIHRSTSAICVAWEGSGAARAAAFNNKRSLEIRGVTDAADKEAPVRFDTNLPIAMGNIATTLGSWLDG